MSWGGETMPKLRQSRLGTHVPVSNARGFSLLELMVVLVITTLLTALLFPGMRAARDSAHKLMCASNMRQLGTGVMLYASDHKDRVPHSQQADRGFRLDQMSLTVRKNITPGSNELELDGIGLLVGGGSWGFYCDSLECLFCPSHTNNHTLDRYEQGLQVSRYRLLAPQRAFGNFQYVGYDPDRAQVTRLTDANLLITDGFRTQADFNHVHGMNKLYGDGSIEWWSDVANAFYLNLPTGPLANPEDHELTFDTLSLIMGSEDRMMGSN